MICFTLKYCIKFYNFCTETNLNQQANLRSPNILNCFPFLLPANSVYTGTAAVYVPTRAQIWGFVLTQTMCWYQEKTNNLVFTRSYQKLEGIYQWFLLGRISKQQLQTLPVDNSCYRLVFLRPFALLLVRKIGHLREINTVCNHLSG